MAITTWTAEPFIPESADLEELREASVHCMGCPLYENATMTVFGEGPFNARMMLVGEQPGDQEDKAAKPFVGPAGRVLDKAMEESGIEREKVYLTNAVKHFKWVPAPTGERRLHARPRWSEVQACRPWLIAEIGQLFPDVIVCLGSTAATSLLGKDFKVTMERGKPLYNTGHARVVVATIHPSAVLRIGSKKERLEAFSGLVADLKVAVAEANKPVAHLRAS